jgi:hypothetical protein
MVHEVWKDVSGYEGTYQVSDHGNVRRWKSGARTGIEGWRSLRPTTSNGYRYFVLSFRGVIKRIKASRLVLTTFVGAPLLEYEACHNSGDRTDDSLTNLRWDTRKANLADKHKHGTAQIGVRHPMAKLDEDQVLSIISATGNQRAIGEQFGVSQSTVQAIKAGRLWSHLHTEGARA